jgi:DNA-binding beta-propeller fold protein YncE
VAVIDAASRQIMRYVSVGADASINEMPHQIRVSPDGNFWYVVFRNGQYLQKYSTFDDKFISQAHLGPGAWNSVSITPDGNHAFVTNFLPDPLGAVAHVNLQTMAVNSYSPMDSPHGTYFMHSQNVLYVTAQLGNFVYKFDFSTDPNYTFNDNPLKIRMRPGTFPSTTSSFDPHEVIFTPDESKYFVTCQNSNEVRIFNAANDSLIDSIAVGGFPQEMAISPSHHYLLITCQEDSTSPGVQPFIEKGSVFIYNYQLGQLVPINNTATLGLTRVYQPHGIAVDEESSKAFVASLNYSTDGPAPHHPGGCSGRNGFMTAIDLNTLEYVNFFVPDLQFTYLYKAELLSFPYSVMAK